MRTYRELFRTPEFTPFFTAVSVQTAAHTATGLALGTLVYTRTGSPLLAALAMFGPSLAQAAGALTLLSAADRLPPRATLTALALLSAVAACVQAVPGLPLWGAFAVLLVVGAAGSAGGGVRYGLLNEIVPREGFLIGRSVLNMTGGAMQICGFAVGGALVAVVSARGTLLVGAALYVVAAAVTRFGLSARPPRAPGRPSVRETRRTNALLWSSVPRRYVFLALWVPNGLVVGCESLYVAYAWRTPGSSSPAGPWGCWPGTPWWGGSCLSPVASPARGSAAAAAGRAVPPVRAAPGAAGRSGGGGRGEHGVRREPAAPGTAGGAHPARAERPGARARLVGDDGDAGGGGGRGYGIAQLTSPATGMAAVAGLSVAVTSALAPGLGDRRAGGRGRLLGADGVPPEPGAPDAPRAPRTKETS